MHVLIHSPNGYPFTLRSLDKNDSGILGEFFESLSPQTRSKFGPHPLDKEYAKYVICKNIDVDNVSRFIIVTETQVVGYFIVDFNEYPNERSRYSSYGIELDFALDPVFAPCIHDNYQGQGLASLGLDALLRYFDNSKIRSLVLMGGTQEPNLLARNLYKKFGFVEIGEFYTDYNRLNNVDMRLVR